MAANLAVKAKRELQARVSDVHKDVLQSEKDMFAVTTDMTRQYKVCAVGGGGGEVALPVACHPPVVDTFCGMCNIFRQWKKGI